MKKSEKKVTGTGSGIQNEIMVKNSYIGNLAPQPVQGRIMQNPAVTSLKGKKLPSQPHYWIRRALDKVNQESRFFGEERIRLNEKHAKKDEAGDPLVCLREFKKLSLPNVSASKVPDDAISAMGDAIKAKIGAELKETEWPAALEQFEKAKAGDFISKAFAESLAKWSDKKISSDGDGNISIENLEEYNKELITFFDTEIPLGIAKVPVDLAEWDANPKVDFLTGEELDILLPLIEVKE